MKQKITQKRLKEVLHYDPDTGIFKSIIGRKGIKCIGAELGHIGRYVKIAIDKKRYYAHRLAFLYIEGYFPENDVDHIDRDKLNNKWSNLREVSRRCNLRNCDIRETNKSGITGVSWSKEKRLWVASITINYKMIQLGRFPSIKSAAIARYNAEKEHSFYKCNSKSSAYKFLNKE